jgi:hypothetical protein
MSCGYDRFTVQEHDWHATVSPTKEAPAARGHWKDRLEYVLFQWNGIGK